MKPYWQNERGYALLLAFCTILIFSILGLSLLTLTSSGVAKNTNREEIILATDLSDKGIEFAVNDIQKTLEEQIVATPMGKTEFSEYLDIKLNDSKLKCPAIVHPIPDKIGYEIKAENNNKTWVCIEDVKNLPSTEERDKYKRIVTFRSVGIVNGKEHTTKSEVIVGTDAIPDQLRYAVSSNKNGSLYLHGGVEVTGDIKSAANVHIIKKAFSGWNYNPTWHPSVALKMNPTVGSSSSKIILSDPNKKIYYYNGDQFGQGKNIEYKSPTNTYTINNQKEIRSILTQSAKTNILSKNVPEDTIDVQSKVEDVYNNNTFNELKGKEEVQGNTSNLNQSEDSVTLVYDACIQYNHNSSKSCKKSGLGETHLKIENKYEVKIQGTYYINGDLTINNANVKSNAILYVDGDVEIRFSTLSELKSNSSLIIFASGSIFISNISEYSDSPSTIKGFFYSQNDMTLYGVGSNLKIIGGISARNLYLTAVRGSVKNTDNIPSEETQLDSNSRLQIIYDENIIKQYTDFKRDEEEEFITSINPPETISRQ